MFPTPEQFANLSWHELLEYVGLAAEVWKAVATELGDESLSIALLECWVDPSELDSAAKKLQLNPLTRARVDMFVNMCRSGYGMSLHDFVEVRTTAAVAAVATTAKAPLTTSPTISSTHQEQTEGVAKHTLKGNHYFDQGSRIEVLPLPADRLNEMRLRWSNAMWVAPGKNINLSDKQLSVLGRLADITSLLWIWVSGSVLVQARTSFPDDYVPSELAG